MRISDWSSDVCSSDLHGARSSGGVCRKGVAPALRDGNPALYGKSKRQAARGSPGHAKRGLCTERRLQRACDSRMHCKAVSSFGREIIGKSRSNLARAQLPGVGETRIAMIRTIEKPGRQRPAIYRSALAHRSRRGRQITIPRGAVENSELL